MAEIETFTPGCTHYSFNELIKCTIHNFKRLGHGEAPEAHHVGLALLNAAKCLEPGQWFADFRSGDIVVWPWQPDVILSAIDYLVARGDERLEANKVRASNSGQTRPNGITLNSIASLAEQTSRQETWQKLRKCGFPILHWNEGLCYFDFFYADLPELRAKIEEWKGEVVAARLGATTPRAAKPAEIFATKEA